MLAKRIIPCLDVKDGRVVKGINFVDLVDAGDPVSQAQAYDREGADELVFLDITATHERREIVTDMVRAVADTVFIPFTVGGGPAHGRRHARDSAGRGGQSQPQLRRRAQPRNHQRRGQTLWQPVHRRRHRRGGCDRGEAREQRGEGWDVYVSGGRTNTELDAVAWAREAERRGAGELLLTSMDGDGTQEGYDVSLTHAISSAVGIPVIASGGAGGRALCPGAHGSGASAALAASLFHFKQMQIMDLKRELAGRGIELECQLNLRNKD